jgi:hypothetical protein
MSGLEPQMTPSIPLRQFLRGARQTGPQFVSSYFLVLRRHRWPAEQIRRFQEHRLDKILRLALERVPAYIETLGTKGSVKRGEGLRTLQQFPLCGRTWPRPCNAGREHSSSYQS